MTAKDRAALLRKYRLLAEWRRLRDRQASAGEGDDDGGDGNGAGVRPVAPTERRALRDLSQEFPGALRELDLLGLPEIERRIDRLSRTKERGRVTPVGGSGDDRDHEGERWIGWILAFHAFMRAALAGKRAAGRSRRIVASAMSATLFTARVAAGAPFEAAIDEPFIHAAAHPPTGRLAVVVMNAMATSIGVPAGEIARTLFPPRRPRAESPQLRSPTRRN